MKVLAIGNSFSQDAMRYLHEIAKSEGHEMKTVNLMIGGCPLSRHFIHMENEDAAYGFEFNGQDTGIQVSIRQALQSDMWDVVTLQQVSHLSPQYETFQPYLSRLSDYVRYHAPKAALMLHQTWAYEQNSRRLCQELGYDDQAAMFADVQTAYAKASIDLGGVDIIPSGEAFQYLYREGLAMHRDTFHASLGLGRYTLGLVWYEFLTGNSCVGNAFRAFDEAVPEREALLAQQCAHQAVGAYREK